MRKNGIRLGLAFLVFALSLGAYQLYWNQSRDHGSKAVQIIIQDDQKKILLDKTVKTDAPTLGDLLDEMIKDHQVTISFAGNKTDLYGRYITKINTISAGTTGPWWVYASPNNTECLAAGYCGGIDVNPIHDQDRFTFSLSMGY